VRSANAGAQAYGNAAAQERLSSASTSTDDTVAWGVGSQTSRSLASSNRYTVVSGDTLTGLAHQAGQPSYDELYNLNRDHMPDAHTIHVGQVLVLPVGWALPGMVNDPNTLTGDPLAQASSEYEDPYLELGTQVDSATGATTGAPGDTPGAVIAGARTVEVLRGWSNPLIVNQGGAPPKDAQLYRDTPKGDQVANTVGTASNPNIYSEAEGSDMFIGGTPTAADVRQGGLGDCYFLSTLLGLVEGDPGKINQMMSYDGQNVTTTFKRYDLGSKSWVDCNVTVTNDLQVDSAGPAAGELTGSKARIGDDPIRSEYSAATYSGDLEVDRFDSYQMALWVPLMEKCYARFAEEHGKYGMGAGTGGGGYDLIDTGGGSENCYQIFYGDDAKAFKTSINFATEVDPVVINLDAIRSLVNYSNTQQNPGPGGGTETFMHARIGPTGAAKRCVSLIEEVTADWWVWPWETNTLDPALEGLKTDIEAWQASTAAADMTTMLNTARAVSAPGANPELWDEENGQDYRDLLEVIKIVSNFSTDTGSGARSVYAAHAYHVKDVFFKDSDGNALNLTDANVATHLKSISGMDSSVVLENPHASGEMDLDGNGPDQDNDNDGRFEISLHSFLTNMDLLRGATVAH